MGSRSIQAELCAQLRELSSKIPPFGASAAQRADYEIRKAEFLDLLSVVEPRVSMQARDLAIRARYEAQAATREY